MAITDLLGGLPELPGLDTFGLGGLLGTGNADLPPLAAERPARTLSFQRKWSTALPLVQRMFPQEAWHPVLQIDADRVARGQNVLSPQETLLALKSATTKQAQTPQHEPNIIEKAFNDVRQFVTGIPQMPKQIIQEIPQIPGGVKAGLGDIAHGDIAKAAQEPGIRFLPGSYVAGQLASGENPFAEHPVYSLLDLLPYAEAGAARLPRVAAESARLMELGDVTHAAPLRTAMREYAVNPIGEAVQAKTGFRLKDWLNNAGLGSDVQDVSAIVARTGRQITDRYSKEAVAQLREIGRRYDDIPIERRVELSGIAGDPTFDRTTLPAHHQNYLNDFHDWMERNLTETAGEHLIDINGEKYPAVSTKAQTLARKTEQLPKLEDRVADLTDKAEMNRRGLSTAASKTFPYMTDALEGVTPAEFKTMAAEFVTHTAPDAAAAVLNNDYTSIIADPRFHKFMESRALPGVLDALDEKAATIMDDVSRGMGGDIKTLDPLIGPGGKLSKAMRQLRHDRVTDMARGVNNLERITRTLNDAGQTDLATRVGDLYTRATSVHLYRKQLTDWNKRFRDSQDLARRLDTATNARAGVRESISGLLVDPENIPRRWHQYVRDQRNQMLEPIIKSLPDEAQRDARWRLVNELPLRLESWGVSAKDIKAIQEDAAKMWLVAKDAGLDPRYVHAVDVAQANSLYRSISPLARQVKTESQFKEAIFDSKPVVTDLEISITHMARERYQAIADEMVRDELRTRYGKTQAELVESLIPKASKMVEAGVAPAGVSVGAVVDDLLREQYVDWRPAGVTPTTRGRSPRHVSGAVGEFGQAAGEPVYIPKWLDETMQKMYPHNKGLGGLLTGAHGIFRTFILPFSPRWHVNNVVSGAIMLFARTGPRTFQFFNDARRMIQNGEVPPELARGAISVDAADAAWQFHGGRNLAELDYQNHINTARKLGQAVKTRAERFYEWGEKVDTMYRSMALLYGEDKAIRKGLSAPAAREAGIQMANSILQNWDRMTPVERQVLRMVFPFYGWMKHVMSYTLTLPVDHPTRVAIMANVARNEWDDWGTGVPERFAQYFSIGDTDEKGNVQAVNLQSTNPFSDFANYMTLSGFVAQLSPVAEGLLTSMGINPINGKPEQFNAVVYNQRTGKLETKSQNPAVSLLHSIIPQTELLTSGLGLNGDDLKILKIQDPSAYRNRVLSALGIPFLPRELNVQREAALAEIARDQGATEALNEARRTGDWNYALTFPQIRPLYHVLVAAQQQGSLQPLMAG